MEKEQDLISVIIPVYNIKTLVRQCLESVLQQTYRNLEIIIVDDGSTDGCSEICDEYGQSDNRCIVIHQQNMGLSIARNSGLKIAKGEYIAFVDGDDVIHSKYFEYLHKALNEGDFKIACTHYNSCFYPEIPPLNVNKEYSFSIYNSQELKLGIFCKSIQKKLPKDFIPIPVWSKLYRKEILKDLFFKDTMNEDNEFNFETFNRTNEVIVVSIPLYLWIRHPRSLTLSPPLSKLNTFFYSDNFGLEKIPLEMEEDRGVLLTTFYKKLLSVRHLIKYYPKYKNHPKDFKKIIKSNKQTHWTEFLANKHIKPKEKFVIATFYHFPLLYRLFRLYMEKR